MSPAEQARAFLAMALCGVLCGAAHDALAALRCMTGVGRRMTAAADVLLGVFCAAAMTATALFLQTEPFRLYAFAGVALGAGAYAATVGAGIRRIGRFIGRSVKKS